MAKTAALLQQWQCSGKGATQEPGLVKRSQSHKDALHTLFARATLAAWCNCSAHQDTSSKALTGRRAQTHRLYAVEAMRPHRILWALAASAAFTPPQPLTTPKTVCHGGRPKNKAAKAAQKRLQEAAKEEAKAARTYEALQKKRRESKARRTERLRGRDTRGGTPDVVEITEKKVRRPPPTTPRAEPTKGQAKRPIQSNRQLEARFLGSYTTPDEMPRDPLPEIAFVGRSNVGKSSMLNALVGARKGVAVTGRTPGRTRLLNLFEIEDSGGGRARVVDLPGYGFAKIADAQQADISRFLEAYLDGRRQLRGIVFLVDCRRDPNPEDMDIIQVLRSKNLPVVLVATKIDKLKSSAEFAQSLNALEDFYEVEPLFFSSTTRQGRPELWARVNELLFSPEEEEEAVEWVLDDEPEEDSEPLSDDDLLVF
jgi:GTP-binding protein